MSRYKSTSKHNIPLTNKLNSKEHSPSWEANRSSAIQEFPHILCNPMVHYCIQKDSPSVPILSQNNPDHDSPSQFLNTHLILFSHLRLGLPSGIFPSCSPTKNLQISCPPFVLHAASISSLFDHPNNIWWKQGIINLVFHLSPCFNCNMFLFG